MENNKRASARAHLWDLENEPLDGTDNLISWEEAEWTRQALGMTSSDFALMLGVKTAVVYRGQKYPQTFLTAQAAILLRLWVNRRGIGRRL